jgi:putative hydrolase of the HAD superfamily
VYAKKKVVRVVWLLCDYGEVISMPQPSEDLHAMVSVSGCDRTEFLSRYWSHRPAYDRADIGAREYWQRITQTDIDQTRLEVLVELDVKSWLHPDSAVLDAVLRAHDRGYHLALLSNAPSELADALENISWLALFDPKIFSCRLRASKPDPAVYTAALACLSAPPEDVVFFDDRAANIDAARELGIRAELFTGVPQLDRLPSLLQRDNPLL